MSYPSPPPPEAKGPFRGWAKAAICLIPLATASLLAFVPALLLATRRKDRADVVGAVVVGLTEMGMLICAALAGKADREPANTIGASLVALLVFGAPVHFLVMDGRAAWARLRPRPVPAYPSPQPVPAYPYPQPYGAYPQPYPPQAPAPVDPQPPTRTPRPVRDQPPAQARSGPTDDLRELGELLRRQAGGDRQ
ncbi:hypothetical protein [Kitasatospora humi]|uniref:hypothetical protein n=1 Tax=Kitasatospora humi TaxID=2893891 RepID=UPI0024BFF41C|nr:hypothetical protein [Kitasatospora humi]